MNSATVRAGKVPGHGHHVGHAHQAGDRLHVLQEVEGQLRIEGGVDRVGRVDQEDGVAVGRRFHRHLGADVVAAARPVLHHHLLPEPLGQPGAHQAGQQVGRAARRVGNDELDRLGGIVGLGRCRQREQAAEQDQAGEDPRDRSHRGSCDRQGPQATRRRPPTSIGTDLLSLPLRKGLGWGRSGACISAVRRPRSPVAGA